MMTYRREELVQITRVDTSWVVVRVWRADTPNVKLVTPVAQTLEMAKSELARQKVIRGKKRR